MASTDLEVEASKKGRVSLMDNSALDMLGNVVISKKILRTRKIMLMHSNERGECCLRTLVDRKRKRYDNAVDVVVRLHDRRILAPKVRHLRNLHTFGSVTSHELTIQQSVEGELRQHDGVMTVMMKLPA